MKQYKALNLDKQVIYGDLVTVDSDLSEASFTFLLDGVVVIYETICERITRELPVSDGFKIPLYDGDILHESGSYIIWDDNLFCWAFQHLKDVKDGLMTPLFYDRNSLSKLEDTYGNIKFKNYL